MGSHFKYENRYPHTAEFMPFTSDLDSGWYGAASNASDRINAYDNSVYYNDFVVSKIFRMTQKLAGRVGFIYMPDHAEDAIGGRAHHLTLFTYEMNQIPMLAWFNKAYQTFYPKKYRAMVTHKHTLFSNDTLYDTLIGITGIQTERYQKKHDLSSAEYRLNPKEAKIFHGSRNYRDSANYIFLQQENIRYLRTHQNKSKLFVSHVNSIGKARDIISAGCKQIQSNFKWESKKQIFDLVHHGASRHLSMYSFLKGLPEKEIDKWIINLEGEIKNHDIDGVVTRLEQLDQQYHMKDRTVIVLSKPPLVLLLKLKGWQLAIQDNNGSESDYYYHAGCHLKYLSYQRYRSLKEKEKEKGKWQYIINDAVDLSKINLYKDRTLVQILNDSGIKMLTGTFVSQFE